MLSKSLFNEKDSVQVTVQPGRDTVAGIQPWAAAGKLSTRLRGLGSAPQAEATERCRFNKRDLHQTSLSSL